MDQLTEGVHRLPVGSNAYLVDGDEGVVLIDTGLPGKLQRLRDGLASIGRGFDDVRAVLITHAHTDHIGGAAAVVAAGARGVCMSPVDAPVARGEQPVPAPPVADVLGPLRHAFWLLPTPDPFAVDHEVDESEGTGLPQDWRVIETPGHTPGHVSFLLDRAGGLLFAGDAAMANRRGRVVRGPMNAWSRAVDHGIDRLAREEFTAAYFGHGRALRSGASGAFRRYAARRA